MKKRRRKKHLKSETVVITTSKIIINDISDLVEKIEICDLVRELSKREGVEAIIIEPYQKVDFKAEPSETGPMIILKIID